MPVTLESRGDRDDCQDRTMIARSFSWSRVEIGVPEGFIYQFASLLSG